jgi:hypothetical protein
MLAPLTIGSTFYVAPTARMRGHGLATVIANPRPGVYVLRFPDGAIDTLADSE